MEPSLRKKSPRAPALTLNDAIDRAAKIYKHEGRHPAPTEVIAKHLGYSSAKNGSALSTIASLGYFGIVERPKGAQIAVVKDFETFTYTQDSVVKREILIKWLKTPPVFADLLEKYGDRLPSDGNIQFDLIQKGFLPAAAQACVLIFRRSVEESGIFSLPPAAQMQEEVDGCVGDDSQQAGDPRGMAKAPHRAESNNSATSSQEGSSTDQAVDRIPVRLSGGRRAVLEIPIPFFAQDRARLVAQLEILITDDEE